MATPRAAHPPAVIDGVTVVNWPAGSEAPSAVVPALRVLVVADGEPVPLVWDDLERWVLDGVAPTGVAVREVREEPVRPAGSGPPSAPHPPVLDVDGIVRGPSGRWAAVPPIEARLLAPLLDRPGHVVHRADLHDAAWPANDVGERTLDGRIKLLRRRIAPLGLRIHTVRGLGYLLEVLPQP